MRKTLIIIIFLGTFVFISNLNAEETVISLLKSDDWHERDRAVSVIDRDIEKYKNDVLVKNILLDTLRKENKYFNDLYNNRLSESDQAKVCGECHLELVKLVIKLDIPNSTETLVDSADVGNIVEDFIVKQLVNEKEDDLKTLSLIQNKVSSSDLFYKGKRSSYVRILDKYLDKTRGEVAPNKKTIMKGIVQKELISNDRFTKEYAIRCSKYFLDDKEVIDKLRNISKTDTYARKKNGVKVYPLREEALNVLKGLK